ncbi:Hypothetical protein, putative [Bodo saltans]|uniref:Uncharacterized protein n=1 Tax=Bodo saltans TaxID=75058 RepID=A0A0S4KJS9_BODSA|nr:Hypothetical protein, putative [Bodo saltans]|eukprot:CUI15444.1 Hypothetical protein, putative [Bodo saltans]
MTESIATEVDSVIALVERNRRKQIESLISVLDASDTLASQVGVPLSGHPSGGGIICTPYLWTLEKQISFHQGKLAFGESLLRSAPPHSHLTTNAGAPQLDVLSNDSVMHPILRESVNLRQTPHMTMNHAAQSSHPLPSMKHAPYPFESPNMFETHQDSQPYRHGVQHHSQKTHDAHLRGASAMSESLMDSKFGLSDVEQKHPQRVHIINDHHLQAKKKSESDVSATNHHRNNASHMSYKSLLRSSTPQQKHQQHASSSFREERSYSTSTYARENLTYVKRSRSPSPATFLPYRGAQTSTAPKQAADDEFPQSTNMNTHHHACCGLDIDRWSVRSTMHASEAALSELAMEYQLALEDCLRTTAIKREEGHARCLVEAMFYASMPTHRISQHVCKRVQALEQNVAVDRAHLYHLEMQSTTYQAQKDQLIRDANDDKKKIIEDFRALMTSERDKMRDLLDSICTTTIVAVLELQESFRHIVQELQQSEFTRIIAVASSGYASKCFQRFLASTVVNKTTVDESITNSSAHDILAKHHRARRSGGDQHATSLWQEMLWLEDITNETTTAFNIKARHVSSQTDEEKEAGRWLEHSEEQRIRLAWYRKHETFLTLSMAFLFQLEHSERQRIEEEEEDTIVKDHTSWNATAQHFLNVREAAHKDAHVAALQMDLAALRGTASMVSRSTSVGPTTGSFDAMGGGSAYYTSPNGNASFPFASSSNNANQRGSIIRQHRAASLPQSSLIPSIYEYSHEYMATPEAGMVQRQQSSARGQNATSAAVNNSRSFYAAVRSISPFNVSESNVGSAAASRSASVRANSFAVQNSFGAMVESIAQEPLPVMHNLPRQPSFGTQTFVNTATPRATSYVRTLAPVALPGMEFPSVPIVVSMALTLEDLGREDVMRKEAAELRNILIAFHQEEEGRFLNG